MALIIKCSNNLVTDYYLELCDFKTYVNEIHNKQSENRPQFFK